MFTCSLQSLQRTVFLLVLTEPFGANYKEKTYLGSQVTCHNLAVTLDYLNGPQLESRCYYYCGKSLQ